MTVSANDLLAVLGAIALAGIGGELFLKGVLAAAAWLRVPKLLVATSLVAFATSSPELTVSTVAALAGEPEIGLGNALGANVVNIALIFGLALMFGPLRMGHGEIGRDFGFALAIPLLTLWFATDGLISRAEGGLLLVIFAVWMSLLIRSGLARRGDIEFEAQMRHPWLSILFGAAGFGALVLAGHLFVSGASGIAAAFGVDTYIVGATIVAIGTTLPELVTVLLARIRGHDDIGVGTLLGSSLFNGMAVIGIAASIHPIQAPLAEIAITLGMGLIALLLLIPGRHRRIGRGRGALLLTCYVVFIIATLIAGRSA